MRKLIIALAATFAVANTAQADHNSKDQQPVYLGEHLKLPSAWFSHDYFDAALIYHYVDHRKNADGGMLVLGFSRQTSKHIYVAGELQASRVKDQASRSFANQNLRIGMGTHKMWTPHMEGYVEGGLNYLKGSEDLVDGLDDNDVGYYAKIGTRFKMLLESDLDSALIVRDGKPGWEGKLTLPFDGPHALGVIGKFYDANYGYNFAVGLTYSYSFDRAPQR